MALKAICTGMEIPLKKSQDTILQGYHLFGGLHSDKFIIFNQYLHLTNTPMLEGRYFQFSSFSPALSNPCASPELLYKLLSLWPLCCVLCFPYLNPCLLTLIHSLVRTDLIHTSLGKYFSKLLTFLSDLSLTRPVPKQKLESGVEK